MPKDVVHEIEGHKFKIKPDLTAKNKFYCVMQNPFTDRHDTKVLFGGSQDIVSRKIDKQYKIFKVDSEC
jgi:hypothetical protein